MARYPSDHQYCDDNRHETEFSDDEISLFDTFFGFLDEGVLDNSSPNSSITTDNVNGDNTNDINEETDDDNNNEEETENIAHVQAISFCDLEVPLIIPDRRYSYFKSIIIYDDPFREMLKLRAEMRCVCVCGRTVPAGIMSCWTCQTKMIFAPLRKYDFLRSNHLIKSAILFDSRRIGSILPGGEHTFLEVQDISNPKKIEMKVMIKFNDRGEFEMIRASGKYDQIVKKLPEDYITKIKNLLSVTEILCSAAEKCMKEKKMNMVQSRKHKCIQAKYYRKSKRMTSFGAFGRRNI